MFVWGAKVKKEIKEGTTTRHLPEILPKPPTVVLPVRQHLASRWVPKASEPGKNLSDTIRKKTPFSGPEGAFCGILAYLQVQKRCLITAAQPLGIVFL
jgi:hypothetical protein